ncbi:unnamed protein product [Closterium sp. NIES-65]|nr:unnamed protein product [Closterium sp. NIES-65]
MPVHGMLANRSNNAGVSGSASSGRRTVIQAIDQTAIRRICPGQVVLDVAGGEGAGGELCRCQWGTCFFPPPACHFPPPSPPPPSPSAVVLDVAGAAKELVENSLDAGATSVEVCLKKFGAELIEVADNGCGVAPPNWQVTLDAGAMSMEVRLKDLGADLFKMADNGCGVTPPNWQALTLKYHTSKIAHLADLQSLSSFGFRGEALSSLSTLADVTITTRTANEPIATRLAFDQAGKLLDAPREQSGRSSARITVVQTAGTGLMRENIIPVFGAKAAGGLDPVDITFPLSPAAITAAPPAPAAATVDLPRLSKLLNELYRFFNSLQFPTAFLNVSLRADAYDVNVTPDKRKVFLHSEAALLSGLRAALSEFYSPNRGSRRDELIGDGDGDGDGDGQIEEAEGGEVEETEGDRRKPLYQFERGEGGGKATLVAAVGEAAQ